jgi:hypothetical protein
MSIAATAATAATAAYANANATAASTSVMAASTTVTSAAVMATATTMAASAVAVAASTAVAAVAAVADKFDQPGCSIAFLVEDVERCQADISDFFLMEGDLIVISVASLVPVQARQTRCSPATMIIQRPLELAELCSVAFAKCVSKLTWANSFPTGRLQTA